MTQLVKGFTKYGGFFYSRGKMKIAFLFHYLPYPVKTGTTVRISKIANYLSQRHSLSLIFFGNRQHLNITHIEKGIFQEVIPIGLPFSSYSNIHYKARQLISWIKMFPFVIDQRLKNYLTRLLLEREFEYLYINGTLISAYLDFKQLGNRLKIVLDDACNSHLLYENIMQIAPNFLSRLRARFRRFKMLRYEKNLMLNKVQFISVSGREEKIIKKINKNAQTYILPQGADLEYFGYQPFNSLTSKNLIFCGDFSYHPNCDALNHFMQDIAPKILHKVPEIRLIILGRNMPNHLEENIRNQNWITHLGFVDDIREAFEKASIFINPMRIAKGINTKVIEALAMGKAVVAYQTGIESLPIKSGVDFMLANDSFEFAEHINELICNFPLRRKIGEIARQKAESQFSWKQILPALDSIVR